MSNLRNIGYKIFLLSNKVENGKENLCKMLNFNDNDYTRLVTGRLSITPMQIKNIAEFFSVDPIEILNYKNNDAYSKMVHCMSNFEKNENCDEILDIIDTYIDFVEAAQNIN